MMKAKHEESLAQLIANGQTDTVPSLEPAGERLVNSVSEPEPTAIDSDTENRLKELAEQARSANKRGVELLLEIKDILAEAFELHEHVGRASTFGAWVAENFPDLSQRTVERYLKIHKVFADTNADTLSQFDVTALHILSEARVSLNSRKMALLLAAGGGRITAKAARHFATNPWDQVSNNDSLPKATQNRTPKAIQIAVNGGEVIVKPLTDQLTVAAALEEAMRSIHPQTTSHEGPSGD